MSVLITGANRGIGKALFDAYLATGQSVIGTRRSALESDISDPPSWVGLDVTSAESIAAFATSMKQRPVSLLVCNAGIYPDKKESLGDGFPAHMWQEAFHTNVTGVFQTIQTLLPNLSLGDAPKIAIISSIMATSGEAPGGSYIYRATKAAVLNVGRNLAMDLRSNGIAVGIYHPGWVKTDMGSSAADITVEESANGLINRFASLSMATTGCFESYKGDPMPF